MPWKGVTVTEQRQRVLEDYQLKSYSITELAERFCISRKTAHKWINRISNMARSGFVIFPHCVEVGWKRNYPIREYTRR